MQNISWLEQYVLIVYYIDYIVDAFHSSISNQILIDINIKVSDLAYDISTRSKKKC